MFPILLYITGLFWLASILQISLFPFWAGDLIFLLLFIWGLYFSRSIEKSRYKIWAFWLPPIFGLGMASFIFNTNWELLPYLLTAIILTTLMIRKSKWIFRFKEGLFYCLFIFLSFSLSVIFLRSVILDYKITADFYVRFIITFVLGFSVWVYFLSSVKQGKIR